MQFLKFGGGRNFYLKDFRNAYHFRPDVAPPRQKFEGYINFVPNRALYGSFLGSKTDNINLRTRLSSLVRTAQLPEVQIQTQIVNAFNQKRIVTSGREYSPIGITLFDTIQNEWLTMLMKYFTYMFADSTNKHTDAQPGPPRPNDPTRFRTRDIDNEILFENINKYNNSSKFGKGKSPGYDSNAFGFTQRETPYFFERIDIILYHGNTGIQYSLVNPIITSINFGDIDYADSGFKDIQIQLQYEFFTVHDQLNFDLGEQDLARFERMDNVDLPGRYAGDKKPIAIEQPTVIRSVMGRERQPQIHTQFGNAGENVGKENKFVEGETGLIQNSDPTYKPAISRASDPGGILSKISDFFDDNPFGRILDRGLSAAVNGGDVKDALTGGLFNEITQGIQNPVAGDIFKGKGKRVDTGSDPGGEPPDG
tara:strand:- start:199 stop:1467 length:1269 start_codon:yes stop_codon:yes gene_type:complete